MSCVALSVALEMEGVVFETMCWLQRQKAENGRNGRDSHPKVRPQAVKVNILGTSGPSPAQSSDPCVAALAGRKRGREREQGGMAGRIAWLPLHPRDREHRHQR